MVEIAEGVLWLRLPLPFALDHVNVYLIEDGAGFALIDCGVGSDHTTDIWSHVVRRLAPRRLTRVIATHYHADHVGAAGWLTREFDVPLYMSATEFLISRQFCVNPEYSGSGHYRELYVRNGLDLPTVENILHKGHAYLKLVSDIPGTFRRLMAGDEINIGGRNFEVMTGAGHAPEQVMLVCASDRIFFSADQVLARISPNVSIWPDDPNGNPLQHYLTSLRAISDKVASGSLVLPGHGLPFTGLHTRCADLAIHHEHRCAEIIRACEAIPRSAADLIGTLFDRPLDAQQRGFAFTEILAHQRYLAARGELGWIGSSDGIERTVTSRSLS